MLGIHILVLECIYLEKMAAATSFQHISAIYLLRFMCDEGLYIKRTGYDCGNTSKARPCQRTGITRNMRSVIVVY
jgi:hypothetical protein